MAGGSQPPKPTIRSDRPFRSRNEHIVRADGYILSAILHDWNDQDARTIGRRCAEAAGLTGSVFIIERTGDDGESPSDMDLRMLAYFGARERRATQLATLAADTGLELITAHPAGELSISNSGSPLPDNPDQSPSRAKVDHSPENSGLTVADWRLNVGDLLFRSGCRQGPITAGMRHVVPVLVRPPRQAPSCEGPMQVQLPM